MTDVILPLLRHAQNLPALRHSLRLWDCHAFRPLLLLPDNDVQEGVLPVLGHGIHRGLELNETSSFAELFFTLDSIPSSPPRPFSSSCAWGPRCSWERGRRWPTPSSCCTSRRKPKGQAESWRTKMEIVKVYFWPVMKEREGTSLKCWKCWKWCLNQQNILQFENLKIGVATIFMYIRNVDPRLFFGSKTAKCSVGKIPETISIHAYWQSYIESFLNLTSHLGLFLSHLPWLGRRSAGK